VQFSTTGGTVLHGAVLGSGEPGVVLAHQVDNNLCAWLPFARVLRDHGLRALAFDFVKTDLGAADVTAAVAELQREGSRHVVLVGASYGGTSCLAAAGQNPAVVAVVSLSSPASFESMDATAAVQALRLPILFLASEQDTEYATDARTMYAAAASSDKRLQIASGSAHGTQLANESDVQNLLLTWIQAHSGA
jgi:pimeloyl-ACP methyl ester carboxylesterase